MWGGQDIGRLRYMMQAISKRSLHAKLTTSIRAIDREIKVGPDRELHLTLSANFPKITIYNLFRNQVSSMRKVCMSRIWVANRRQATILDSKILFKSQAQQRKITIKCSIDRSLCMVVAQVGDPKGRQITTFKLLWETIWEGLWVIRSIIGPKWSSVPVLPPSPDSTTKTEKGNHPLRKWT